MGRVGQLPGCRLGWKGARDTAVSVDGWLRVCLQGEQCSLLHLCHFQSRNRHRKEEAGDMWGKKEKIRRN